jgi:HEAT repeat protein
MLLMRKRTSENLLSCEKGLVEKVRPFFKKNIDAVPNGRSCWEELGSYLEWRLLPRLLSLAPAWPKDSVWCDGIHFFYGKVQQANVIHALGYSVWRPTDQNKPYHDIEAGIELIELIEIEMRLLDDSTEPYVDYLIKIWANDLCHILTPTGISAVPSCSSPDSTPSFDKIIHTVKDTRRKLGSRGSIASLLTGFSSKGVELLTDLLNSTDVEVRRAASYSLERHGLKKQFAVPFITKALQDPDWEVQHSAANFLWKRFKTDDTYLPLLRQSTSQLLQMFGHEPKVRRNWFGDEILTFLGPLEPSIIHAMTEKLLVEDLRLRATKILWGIGTITEEIRTIYQTAVTSDNKHWRGVAAFSLWRFEIDGGKAFIESSEEPQILLDPMPLATFLDYEYNLALKLMPIDSVKPVVTSILTRSCTHKRLWCQAALVLAVAQQRQPDDESQQLLQTLIPALLQNVTDDSEAIQRYGINALGAIGKDAKAAIPVLISMVYNANAYDYSRSNAAEALVKITPGYDQIVGLFHYLYHQEKYCLSSEALPLLKNLGIEAIPVLLDDLLSGSLQPEDLDYEVFDMLAGYGKDAIPALIELTNDETCRLHAIIALGKTNHSGSVPRLTELLKHEDYQTRIKAAHAFGNLGVLAVDSIPALVNAVSDNDSEVCARAIEALGKMGERAAPSLLELLEGADDFAQGWITTALDRGRKSEMLGSQFISTP